MEQRNQRFGLFIYRWWLRFPYRLHLFQSIRAKKSLANLVSSLKKIRNFTANSRQPFIKQLGENVKWFPENKWQIDGKWTIKGMNHCVAIYLACEYFRECFSISAKRIDINWMKAYLIISLRIAHCLDFPSFLWVDETLSTMNTTIHWYLNIVIMSDEHNIFHVFYRLIHSSFDIHLNSRFWWVDGLFVLCHTKIVLG